MNANLEVKVAIERAIHDRLRDVIQAIADQHGIRVESVSVDWSTHRAFGEKPAHTVSTISAQTRSEHP